MEANDQDNSAYLERDGAVATIVLNRPDTFNSINDAMLRRLGTLVAELEHDGITRAVVIKGAGGHFSCGFGVDYKKPRSVASTRDHADHTADVFWRIWRSNLPFVAAAERCALGGAVYFSGVCDYMVTSPDAEIGMVELKLGLAPPLFNLFPWMMGYRAAKQFLLLGEVINGDKAVEWGIASHSVAEGDVVSKSMEIAHKLAAMPDSVVARVKKSVNRRWELAGMVTGVEQGLDDFCDDKINMGPFQKEFRRTAADIGEREAIAKLGIEFGLRRPYRY